MLSLDVRWNYKLYKDNGSTWEAPQRLVGSHSGNTTFRNPYATIIHAKVRVLCMGAGKRAKGDLNQVFPHPQPPPSRTGKDGRSERVLLNYVNSTVAEPWLNHQIFSDDGGKTWSSPQQAVSLPPWEGVLPGPGNGIQLGTHSSTSPHPGARGREEAGEGGGGILLDWCA